MNRLMFPLLVGVTLGALSLFSPYSAQAQSLNYRTSKLNEYVVDHQGQVAVTPDLRTRRAALPSFYRESEANVQVAAVPVVIFIG